MGNEAGGMMADTELLFSSLPPLYQQFCAGYFDGRDLGSPEPNANRHPAYIHSFNVARAEKAGKPIPAHISRAAAAKIVEEFGK